MHFLSSQFAVCPCNSLECFFGNFSIKDNYWDRQASQTIVILCLIINHNYSFITNHFPPAPLCPLVPLTPSHGFFMENTTPQKQYLNTLFYVITVIHDGPSDVPGAQVRLQPQEAPVSPGNQGAKPRLHPRALHLWGRLQWVEKCYTSLWAVSC